MKKRGTPENAGISRDVYENKGRKKSRRESLEMLMKIKKLYTFLEMFVQNKALNIVLWPADIENQGAGLSLEGTDATRWARKCAYAIPSFRHFRGKLIPLTAPPGE